MKKEGEKGRLTLCLSSLWGDGGAEQGLLGSFSRSCRCAFRQGEGRGSCLGSCHCEGGVGQGLEALDLEVGDQHEQQAVAG